MLRRLLNILFRESASVSRPSNRARFGSGFEQLSDRVVPSTFNFAVNTLADTAYHHISTGQGVDAGTPAGTPVDVNGNASLRAIIKYGDDHPRDANENVNTYNVDLTGNGVAGGTITLSDAVGFQRLALTANFNFTAGGAGVTIARSSAAGTAAFNLFDVSTGTVNHFFGMTFHNGKSAAAFDGGAIWNNGRAEFEACEFTNNSTDNRGGAIATQSGATTIANNCTFMYNTAGIDGGAIAALPGSVVTNLANCFLTENEAVGNGGAVWAKGTGSLTISGSSITWNQVIGTGAGQGLGGGVYVEDTATATISQTTIWHNAASWQGGGLYVLNCSLTMTDGSLTDNTSAMNGGGFYVDAKDKTVTLTHVSITGNTSTNGKGGGGYIIEGTLAGELTAGQLTGNTAGGGLAGIGAGLNALPTITVAGGQQTVEFNRP